MYIKVQPLAYFTAGYHLPNGVRNAQYFDLLPPAFPTLSPMVQQNGAIRTSDNFQTNLDLGIFSSYLPNLVYWVGLGSAMTLQTHLRIVKFFVFSRFRELCENVGNITNIQALFDTILYNIKCLLIQLPFLYGLVNPSRVYG